MWNEKVTGAIADPVRFRKRPGTSPGSMGGLFKGMPAKPWAPIHNYWENLGHQCEHGRWCCTIFVLYLVFICWMSSRETSPVRKRANYLCFN